MGVSAVTGPAVREPSGEIGKGGEQRGPELCLGQGPVRPEGIFGAACSLTGLGEEEDFHG